MKTLLLMFTFSLISCAHTSAPKVTADPQALAHMSSDTAQARMLPEMDQKTGSIYGYKFIEIQPESIYEQMGFEVQDVILSVNDKPVTEPRNAMEFYQSLKNGEPLEVSIMRDGRELIIPLHQ